MNPLHALIGFILTVSLTMLAFAASYGLVKSVDYLIDRYL